MKMRSGSFRHQEAMRICTLVILCLTFVRPLPCPAQTESNDLSGVRVAVYNGVGVMSSSRIALHRMFEWMNATVDSITASQILDGSLEAHDILVIPGGSEGTCSDELETEGMDIVKQFVAEGGSYFGICGGATFGARYLHLFNGFMGPVGEPGDLIHATVMHANHSCKGPDLSGFPQNFTTMYYASQRFTSNPYMETAIHTIARYDYDGSAGMIAFEYGNGSVFLSSPHPEYEEDNDRDDTVFGDDLDDPESEWDLLLKVSEWLIEASYVEDAATPTSTTSITGIDLPLIGLVSTGVVVIVFIAAIVGRRR